MAGCISIITAKKSATSEIIDLLVGLGYRIDRFVGENAAAEFLEKRPETVDLLIIDYGLAARDGFRFLKPIGDIKPLTGVPVLFMAETAELREIQIPHLQPGTFDFIDPVSGLHFLSGRIAVLLGSSIKRLKQDTTKISQSNFFASLAHDLRNPIHGILSYAKFGINKTKNDQLTREKSQHYYQSIQDAGTRLLDLLNDIVELAKLDAGRISFDICERNLGTVAQGIISELLKEIESKQISLTLNEPDFPVQGHFDARQIGQVMRRLLVSCFQTAEAAAEIHLKIETIAPAPEIHSAPDYPVIRFTLQHPQGSYSEERLDDLQHLFRQDRDAASTLGQLGVNFAICQRIIARHSGQIWIEGTPNSGVVFGFDLPIKK
jgi:signal transduction histidine kinase